MIILYHNIKMKDFVTRTISLTAIALTGIISTTPVSAGRLNEFDICAVDLQDRGIGATAAAKACAMAIEPEELSECVARINEATSVVAVNALSACFQVRRPEELGRCVEKIDRDIRGVNGNLAMEYCRRSLLPQRFSECVAGLYRRLSLEPAQAMRTCIEVKDKLEPEELPRPTTEV